MEISAARRACTAERRRTTNHDCDDDDDFASWYVPTDAGRPARKRKRAEGRTNERRDSSNVRAPEPPTTNSKAEARRAVTPREPSEDGERSKRWPVSSGFPRRYRRVLAFDVGSRHFASAVVALHGKQREEEVEIEHLDLCDLIEAAGSDEPDATRISGMKLAEYALRYLDSAREALLGRRPDAIVIEQQPGAKMRGIALVVYSFCRQRFSDGDRPPIVSQSGTQKLRVMIGPDAEREAAAARRQPRAADEPRHRRRKRHKERAVQQFENLLAYYPRCARWRQEYEAFSVHEDKRDDVADAVLHALFFLKLGCTTLPRGHPGYVILPGSSRCIPAPITLDLVDSLPDSQPSSEEIALLAAERIDADPGRSGLANRRADERETEIRSSSDDDNDGDRHDRSANEREYEYYGEAEGETEDRDDDPRGNEDDGGIEAKTRDRFRGPMGGAMGRAPRPAIDLIDLVDD